MKAMTFQKRRRTGLPIYSVGWFLCVLPWNNLKQYPKFSYLRCSLTGFGQISLVGWIVIAAIVLLIVGCAVFITLMLCAKEGHRRGAEVEKRFRHIMTEGNFFIILYDMFQKCIYMPPSRTKKSYYRISANPEYIFKRKLVFPEDRDAYERFYEAINRCEEAEGELRIQSAANTYTWIRIKVDFDDMKANAKPKKVMILAEDINEQREKERITRKEKHEHEKIITAMHNAIDKDYSYINIFDIQDKTYERVRFPDNEVVEINGRLSDYFRYIARNYECEAPENKQYFVSEDIVIKHLENKGNITFRDRLRRNGGRYRWYDVYLERMEYEKKGQSLYIMRVRDVEDLKKNEERLKKALKQAEDAGIAKQEFLANMSHEIRTPLTGIMGMLEIMKQHPGSDTDRWLEAAMLSARHLMCLANDVLDMSKISNGKLTLKEEINNWKSVFTPVENTMYSMAVDKGIFFTAEYEMNGIEYLVCDKARINQILVNLISNAIKYTANAGRVSYSVICEKVENDKASILIVVDDNGKGMSKEFKRIAMIPFEQEERRYDGGVGLGLPITKNLVDIMHGHIQIDSEVGKGTCVKVVLPLKKAEDKEVKEVMVKEGKIMGKYHVDGKRALLVEDNEINAEIAQILLKDFGFVVEWVEDGQQAIEKFEESDPYFYSIIFMDIMMPVVDGLTATSTIREMDREDAKTVPIVAMTANAFAEDVHKSFASGMNYHLSKPFQREEISDVIMSLFPDTVEALGETK